MTPDTRFVLVLRADATLADLANMMRLATLCEHFRALWEPAAELTMAPAAVHARAEAIASDLSARGLATGEPLSMLAYVRAFGERRAPAALFAVAYDRCVRAADGDHLYTAGELLTFLAPACVAVPVSAIADVVPEELRGVFWGDSWTHDAAWMAKYGARAYVPPPNDAAPTTDAFAKEGVAANAAAPVATKDAAPGKPAKAKTAKFSLPISGRAFVYDLDKMRAEEDKITRNDVHDFSSTLAWRLRTFHRAISDALNATVENMVVLSVPSYAILCQQLLEDVEEAVADFYTHYRVGK